MNNLNPLYEIVQIQQTAKKIFDPRTGKKVIKSLPMTQTVAGKTKQGLLSNKTARRLGLNPAEIGSAGNTMPIIGSNGIYREKIAGQNLDRKLLSSMGKH